MLRNFSACKLIFKALPASEATWTGLCCQQAQFGHFGGCQGAAGALQDSGVSPSIWCGQKAQHCRLQLEGSRDPCTSLKSSVFLPWLLASPCPIPQGEADLLPCAGAALATAPGALWNLNSRFLPTQGWLSESRKREGEPPPPSAQAERDTEGKMCFLLCRLSPGDFSVAIITGASSEHACWCGTRYLFWK